MDPELPRISGGMFPDIYESLGLDTENLGCLMIDVEPFETTALVTNGENDLYIGDNGVHTFGEPLVKHVTLFHGFLQSATVFAPFIDEILDGWEIPDVPILGVSAFPKGPNADYTVIKLDVLPTPELLWGHDAVSLLPHIDFHPQYHPHVTAAYVIDGPSDVSWADSIVDKWVQTLDAVFAGNTLNSLGLNYGS